MEWNGMGWDGMEWDGMEWDGMEWNGMKWNVSFREPAGTAHQPGQKLQTTVAVRAAKSSAYLEREGR